MRQLTFPPARGRGAPERTLRSAPTRLPSSAPGVPLLRVLALERDRAFPEPYNPLTPEQRVETRRAQLRLQAALASRAEALVEILRPILS